MSLKTKDPVKFIFDSYSFNLDTGALSLVYGDDTGRRYEELAEFVIPDGGVAKDVIPVVEAIAFYLFMIAGSSYYKLFPTKEVEINQGGLDGWQAGFFSMLYKGGLSQYAYENGLAGDDIIEFSQTRSESPQGSDYMPRGLMLMQSGGKDSLLSAELLKQRKVDYDMWHMSTTGEYPKVLDMVGADVSVSKRTIDISAIKQARSEGGLNGHVPFSAIFAGYALLQAALNGDNTVVASNEKSADEANITIDGYDINHQFSKTFKVELALQEYIHRYISPDLNYGSLLRPLTELRVGELFAEHAWPKYKNHFSSCNLANYKQGEDTGDLSWDGTCPKCANSFLLFAPFVDKDELLDVFNGKNLLQDPELMETFRQLLGMSDIKPFECVGTFEEMRYAYVLARDKDPAAYTNDQLSVSNEFMSYKNVHSHQPFFDDLIDYYSL